MKSTYDRLAEYQGVPSPFDPYLTSDDERMVFSFFYHEPQVSIIFMQGLIALSHEAMGEEPTKYFGSNKLAYKMSQKTGATFGRHVCSYSQRYWNETYPPFTNRLLTAFWQWLGSRPLRLECSARLKNRYSKERDEYKSFAEAAAQWLMPEADRLRNLYFLLEQHLMENTNG